MKARHLVIGLALAVGNWSGSAHAIEMFTNFNNGMETGTRPLGFDPMGPVRFHANQHEALWPGRWQQQARCMTGPQPVEFNQPAMPPAERIPAPKKSTPKPPEPERIEVQSPTGQPPFGAEAVQLRPEPPVPQADRGPTAVRSTGDDGDWQRGQSFLPVDAGS